jgi:uncharacterized protein YjbI with pentapeptide repeats
VKESFLKITDRDYIKEYGATCINYKNDSTVFENLVFEDIGVIAETIIINYENGSRTQPLSSHGSSKKTIFFKKCHFKKVLFNGLLKHNYWFESCTFNVVLFENISSENKGTDFVTFKTSEFKKLEIKNCDFNTRFYINPKHKNDEKSHVCKIDNLEMIDTVFNKNFKLHDCELKEIEIDNCDFEKNADFFKSKFLHKNETIFKGLNFRGLALFGECQFNSKLLLEYVTFEKLTHFREAIFKHGIDLEKVNIEKELNFYGAKGLDHKASIEETSQESYRIIKHSFQSVGNTIEANKYHSFELEKRKNDLWKLSFKEKKEKWQELFVFEFHWRTSQHSRNWLLPLAWILVIGFFTTIINDINSWVHLKSIFCNISEKHVDKLIDKTIKYMSIINFDDSLKKTPWLFLLNKSALGYLYYQFITAIRKDTKT